MDDGIVTVSHPDDAAILGRIDDAFAEIGALSLPKQFQSHTATITAALTDQRDYLSRRNHMVCAVGQIGSAKTTTICAMADMMVPAAALRQRTMMLTGAGRTTPCNVTVTMAEQPRITVEPVAVDDLRINVQWLVSTVIEAGRAGDEAVPQEIARCLRGLCGLRGEETFSKFVKSAAEENPIDTIRAVVDLLMMQIKHNERTITTLQPDEGVEWQPWLKTTFARICDGLMPGVSLPQQIVVEAPLLLEGPYRLSYLDTRGLDNSTAREDIFNAIRDPRACLMFTCGWGEAPGIGVQEVLTRIRDEDVRLLNKCLIVVTHRNDEWANTRDEVTSEDAADREAGYRIKIAQVERALADVGVNGVPVLAFDARVDSPEPLRMMVNHIIGAMRERVAEAAHSSIEAARDLPDAVRRLEGFFEDMQSVLHRHEAAIFDPREAFRNTVLAMASMHARSVWAMARRRGEYIRLNFYSEMAENMSTSARQSVSKFIEALHEIIQIKLENPAFAIAHSYLRTILERVETQHNDFLRAVRTGSQGVYAVPMQGDAAIWGWDSEEYSGFRRHLVIDGLMTFSRQTELHERARQLFTEQFQRRFINPLRELARAD